MANDKHVALLKRDVAAWNAWRRKNPNIRPDLSNADLSNADLSGADLSGANLREAILFKANLGRADPVEANLRDHADLSGADLASANLREAVLFKANLTGADLSGADLSGADLSLAPLVEADLTGAVLTGCRIYGVSAWGLKLERAKQHNLVVTPKDEPDITVDNIEVAQFIYLLLNNPKIRDVIDTIGKKAVLILGRFTPERKAVLDALREELRRQNYLPILFDFEKPGSRDFTETVSTLAHLARFIIADLTEPSSIPKELEAIVPTHAVPVQPLLEGSNRSYSLFKGCWKYHWVLAVHWYNGREGLMTSLKEKVITPAEAKVRELEGKRKAIEGN